MINMMEVLRVEIENIIIDGMERAMGKGRLARVDLAPALPLSVEIPKEKDHGDFSSNVAMKTARLFRQSPQNIALAIIENVCKDGTFVDRIEMAGPGFINFYTNNDWLYEALKAAKKYGARYGRSDLGKGKNIMVEFVSANPTGPLHMGNARGGALGDGIAGVLEAVGYNVTREFYVNDAGNQIEKFALSLEARFLQQLYGEDHVEFPEDGYHGEDIIDHVKNYIAKNPKGLEGADPKTRRDILAQYALTGNVADMKRILKDYGIEYDVWFSEKSLYESHELEETIELLKDGGYTYERDGALWFKYPADENKDEVLVRQNGLPTYFATDIAYHRNKFLKRGFDRVINLWGADHHGHVARMKAAMKALGIDDDRLEIVIFQLVRLMRNNEIVRMSKRTGKAVSLSDLLDETGRDAARFFFNMKGAGSHLDFDLDLAVKQSNENPVFYVQYAHARICSILRLLESEGIKIREMEGINLELLGAAEELDLLKMIASYPEEVRIAAQGLEPARLTRFVIDLASAFHSFYNACRVKNDDGDLMQARLLLVECTGIVIYNVLGILKIDAPERM